MRLPIAILAGGLATRMRPLTEQVPKSLLQVAGKPFVEHQLRLLAANRANRVVLCVGHLGSAVRDVVGDGRQFGLEVSYSFDGPVLLGTGGSLKKAAGLLGEHFMVLYGDSYLDIDYRTVEEAYFNAGKPGLMTILPNANRWDRSNVLYHNGKIERYTKRDVVPGMRHIDYGLSVLSATALGDVPSDTPSDLADLLSLLAERGQLAAYEVTKRFYEIGSPRGLRETEEYILSRE